LGRRDFLHFFLLEAISFSRIFLPGSVRKSRCGQWIDFFRVLGFQWENVAKTEKTRTLGLASAGRARSWESALSEKSPGLVKSWGKWVTQGE